MKPIKVDVNYYPSDGKIHSVDPIPIPGLKEGNIRLYSEITDWNKLKDLPFIKRLAFILFPERFRQYVYDELEQKVESVEETSPGRYTVTTEGQSNTK